MQQVLSTPEVRGRIEEQGADVVAGGPERCRRFLTGEFQKLAAEAKANCPVSRVLNAEITLDAKLG